MKAILYIVLFILMASIVSSADLEVKEVKVYKDNKRVSGVDSGGGTITNVKTGSTVEFRITLKNTFNESVTDISISGELDNEYTDIDNFDLAKDNEITKSLLVYVPSDIELNTYIFDLQISGYTINYTDPDKSIRYSFQVNTKTGSGDTLGDLCRNLTAQYATTQTMFNSFLEDEIKLREYRGDCENKKGRLDICLKAQETFESTKTELNNKVNNMQTQINVYETAWLPKDTCTNMTGSAVAKAIDENKGIPYMWALLGVFGIWWWKFRKKDETSAARGVSRYVS